MLRLFKAVSALPSNARLFATKAAKKKPLPKKKKPQPVAKKKELDDDDEDEIEIKKNAPVDPDMQEYVHEFIVREMGLFSCRYDYQMHCLS